MTVLVIFAIGATLGACERSDTVTKKVPETTERRPCSLPHETCVHASMSELRLNDRELSVNLEQGKLGATDMRHGHVVIALHEALLDVAKRDQERAEARGQDWPGRVLFVLDPEFPMKTVLDFTYTGLRAGFSAFAFTTEELEEVTIEIVAPHLLHAGPELHVFIEHAGYRSYGSPTVPSVLLPKQDPEGADAQAWDHTALAALARSRPGLRNVVVSAEDDIRVGVVLATFATLLGPKCDQASRRECRFEQLSIEAPPV